ISGNVMASQKLEFLRKLDPKRAADVVAKLRGGAAPAAAPAARPAAATPPADPAAPRIFAALARRLAGNPRLKQDARATLTFTVPDPAPPEPVCLAGSHPARPDATCTICDADLAALAGGKTTAQQLFQQGKLRIDGDVSVGRRLGFLKGLI